VQSEGLAPQTAQNRVTSSAGRQILALRRTIGVRDQQQVLSGAGILQHRRPLLSLLPDGARYSQLCSGALAKQLSAECSRARVEAVLSTVAPDAEVTQDRTSFAAVLAQQRQRPGFGADLPSVGVDPAFVNTSLLFNPEVSQSEAFV